MLPTLTAFDGQASGLTLQGSYAQWVRAQLRAPADAAIEEALQRASETRARTFKAFVAAFLEAYENERPGESAARAFTDRELSNEALISYLQRRFTEIANEGLLPRLHQSAAPIPVNMSAYGAGAAATSRTLLTAPPRSTTAFSSLPDHVVSIRILSSARSQGP